jgi:RND family efflux transporter MFP subunit
VIRTVGTVDYNETLVRDVNLKVGGWVEKLHVDYLGAPVKAGEPLFELYSPELYAAQDEYLVAWRQVQRAATVSTEVAAGARDLLAAARKRLAYFDIDEAQIQDLQQRGRAAKTLTITSPYDGLVIAKQINEGMKLEPGTLAYRLADLSRVWVMATLYEHQLPLVSLGQPAVMSLSYIPGQSFAGKVVYIYPYLEEKTRQVKVRLEFDNPSLLLKPGMFATVELRSTLAQERTLAPRAAVIDTGTRQVAFVSLGQGRFEPREVKLGVEAQDGMVEILDGLKPGELVVTSGQFLLDSESRVREALAKMVKGEPAAGQPSGAKMAETGALTELPAEGQKALAGVLNSYFVIGEKLAGDTLEGVAAPARQTAGGVDALLKVGVPGNEHFWHQHEEAATVRGKALELVGEKDLAAAREKFADLSTALDKLLRTVGVPADYGAEVQRLHCPMYREGQGGSHWLQKAGEVKNPFYGSVMLGCFDERATLPPSPAQPPQSAPLAPAAPPAPAAMPPSHQH